MRTLHENYPMTEAAKAQLERLAEEYYPEGHFGTAFSRSAYIAGAEALDNLYSEGVGEFDGSVARSAFWQNTANELAYDPKADAHSFEEGAKWQFEQMKGRVGYGILSDELLEESIRLPFKQREDLLREQIKDLEVEIKGLRNKKD